MSRDFWFYISVLGVPGLPVLTSSLEGESDSSENGGGGAGGHAGAGGGAAGGDGNGNDDSDCLSDMHLKKAQQPAPVCIHFMASSLTCRCHCYFINKVDPLYSR